MSAEGRLCLVDDDPSVRESLEALLSVAGFDVSAYGSAEDFLAGFDPERTACVLLDVRMPGMDGLDLLESLDRRSVPIVIMTGHADVPTAVRAMKAGAADFVEKPFTSARLLDSIRGAIARSTPGRPSLDPELRNRFAALTPRETEVMQQMVIGLPNKLIAHHLGMSPRTVEIHRGRVMQKTGADSLSHLVRMAIRAGLDPDAGTP
ncbi:response regulator [Amaricoccus sp.]|uniref:response regulator transcription factor n=1 Tax=Amaricoccus sp. TaxID=1872485 RepID=UPI0026246720|nr:response regulator [Amaricoccus sp.]HRO11114.1 response regulator [Amaricoccus sp.]